VAILRDSRVIVPSSDDPLESGDELLFVTNQDVEAELAALLHASADELGDESAEASPAAE
jgi:trk system potassium uptake protein